MVSSAEAGAAASSGESARDSTSVERVSDAQP